MALTNGCIEGTAIELAGCAGAGQIDAATVGTDTVEEAKTGLAAVEELVLDASGVWNAILGVPNRCSRQTG